MNKKDYSDWTDMELRKIMTKYLINEAFLSSISHLANNVSQIQKKLWK